MSDKSPSTLFIGNIKVTTDVLKETLKKYEFNVQKAFCTGTNSAIVSFNSPLEAQQCHSLITQGTIFEKATVDFARKKGQKRSAEEKESKSKKPKLEDSLEIVEDKVKNLVEEIKEEDEAVLKKKLKEEKKAKRRAERMIKREEKQQKELNPPKNENHTVFPTEFNKPGTTAIVSDHSDESEHSDDDENEEFNKDPKDQPKDLPDVPECKDAEGNVVDRWDKAHSRFEGMIEKKIRKLIKHEKGILRRKRRREAKIAKREAAAAIPKKKGPPKNKAKYDFVERYLLKEMQQRTPKYPDPEEGTTLFVKYIPTDTKEVTLYKLFSKFGPLWYVKMTTDHAFVNFKDASIADHCLEEYEKVKKSNKDSVMVEHTESNFSIDGILLDIVKAKSKEDLKTLMDSKFKKPESTRRLKYLDVGLNLIPEGMKFLHEDNLAERLTILQQRKDQCAQDNESEVDTKRVHLGNIPESWDEKLLSNVIRALMAKIILQKVNPKLKDYELVFKTLNFMAKSLAKKLPWFEEWCDILVEHYYPHVEFESELQTDLLKHFTNPTLPKKQKKNFKLRIPGFNTLWNQLIIKKNEDGTSKGFGFIGFKDQFGAELTVKFLTLLPTTKECGENFLNVLKSNQGTCKNTLMASYAINNKAIIELRRNRIANGKKDKKEEKLKKFADKIEKRRAEIENERRMY